MKPAAADAFKSWLSKRGGFFHKNVVIAEDVYGVSIVAIEDVPTDATIVSCPFSLIITQKLAQTALSSFINVQEISSVENWSERQWISTYICFHWIIGQDREESRNLFHHEYVEMLPSPDKLRTPLFFTTSELEAFKGTNIYGATLDREREWRAEHASCLNVISKANAEWAASFTWERYVVCATYLSSRAFPSSLLARNPSLAQSSSEPILIPGLDILNHARGTAVTWDVAYPRPDNLDMAQSQCEPSISLVVHSAAKPHQELFNNYGPKPNSELILGYGFSAPNNPDDTILLKIGGLNGQRWTVGRDARGVEGLWNEIVESVSSEERPSYEDQLDAASLLMEMTREILDRLPQLDAENDRDMRPEVGTMLDDYVEGQQDILVSVVRFAGQKEQEVIRAAYEEGIELVMDS